MYNNKAGRIIPSCLLSSYSFSGYQDTHLYVKTYMCNDHILCVPLWTLPDKISLCLLCIQCVSPCFQIRIPEFFIFFRQEICSQNRTNCRCGPCYAEPARRFSSWYYIAWFVSIHPSLA